MRFFHKIYAFVFGYFWLPCPICRRYFGGHEKGNGCVMETRTYGSVVCSLCTKEADRRNQELMKGTPMVHYKIIEE